MSLFVKQNNKGGFIFNKDKKSIGKVFNGKGKDILIDGFEYSGQLRIQTHFHTDHTVEFDKSKHIHDIILTHATRDILASNSNSQDIEYRPGIIGIDTETNYEQGDYQIKLINNAHVLGSCQVSISNNGSSIGYSGDFFKPEKFISVDHLIIDGSIGGIFRQRKFTREDSKEALRKIIADKIHDQPIIIKAHSGLLEKIYFWTQDIYNNIPRIGDKRFINTLKVHKKYGWGNIDILDKAEKIGTETIRSDNNYIRFVRQIGEDVFTEDNITVLSCVRFGDNDEYPVLETQNGYIVSISDHADINLTFDYINSINPSVISVDRFRMGNNANADKLLNLIKNEFKEIEIYNIETYERERI